MFLTPMPRARTDETLKFKIFFFWRQTVKRNLFFFSRNARHFVIYAYIFFFFFLNGFLFQEQMARTSYIFKIAICALATVMLNLKLHSIPAKATQINRVFALRRPRERIPFTFRDLRRAFSFGVCACK